MLLKQFYPLLLTILFAIFFNTDVLAKPVKDYLPEGIEFNADIPLPSSSLGFEIGQRHLRHDQLISYFNLLAQQSNRCEINRYGQNRPAQKATISYYL